MSTTYSSATGRYPLLPLRTGVIYPGTVITLPVGRPRSRALVETLTPGSSTLVIGVQRDSRIQSPTLADLHPVATLARVIEVRRPSDDTFAVVVEGLTRVSLSDLVRNEPFWVVEATPLEETRGQAPEAHVLAEALREQLKVMDPDGEGALSKVIAAGGAGDKPGLFADRIAAALGWEADKDLSVLLAVDVVDRLRLVVKLAGEAIATAEMRRKIDAEVRRELGKGQREHVLRQQLKAIQKELGDDNESELSGLKERLAKGSLPEEVQKVADRELRRLEGMNGAQAEAGVIRNYLEWIADLPWSKLAPAVDDLNQVSRKLEEDHYGLAEVKQRILEHMAVLKLSGNPKGTILCLVGPPGVGKTSLGQSIADATGRPFVRIALGGVRDEAEIRGHRRTYVASLPGRIIHGLKKAGARNPVMILDEIDKLSNGGWSGNPEAALLEVLDPEQNKAFVDHYMELPFDLSQVLFICTANSLENLSPPLRDRLEIIEISGYTQEEKRNIARRHLLPKQLKAHNISAETFSLSDLALNAIIRDYTREAGVRQLGREITRLCRAMALEIARSTDAAGVRMDLDEVDLAKHLGKVKFISEVAERTAVPGVATGLAWTPVGGDILFIETSRMPGSGKLEITGQLGDVMKESARAALTFVRSNAAELGVDERFLDRQDIHIHVPAGAVPKDGPSAGVTMFTALTSLLTGRRVRSDTAMTGECTLRGRVLPVGGIKAKVLAAHRAGIQRVILPSRNARDVAEVPEEVRDQLEILFAEDMRQVLAAALEVTVTPDEPLTPVSGQDHGASQISA